jgi:hypothetical protein
VTAAHANKKNAMSRLANRFAPDRQAWRVPFGREKMPAPFGKSGRTQRIGYRTDGPATHLDARKNARHSGTGTAGVSGPWLRMSTDLICGERIMRSSRKCLHESLISSTARAIKGASRKTVAAADAHHHAGAPFPVLLNGLPEELQPRL